MNPLNIGCCVTLAPPFKYIELKCSDQYIAIGKIKTPDNKFTFLTCNQMISKKKPNEKRTIQIICQVIIY